MNFPKPVYRRLRQQAKVFRRPIDDIVVQTVKKGLPLWLDSIPPDFENELSQLDNLSVPQLQKLARSKLSNAKQKKLDRLLEKNSEGTITFKEIEELDSLQLEVDLLTLKKAQALALLYERGHKLSLSKAKDEKP
ncbi:hypothetical protein L0337_12165 [candidate division KSB1 bacterium]|nr:hypothetical protein [candidate division KSB1 bacterium]